MKHSYDKALLFLISEDIDVERYYDKMISEEQQYKGLERVIEAMNVHITLNQSIMKYTTNQGG